MKRSLCFVVMLIMLCGVLSGCGKTGTEPPAALQAEDTVPEQPENGEMPSAPDIDAPEPVSYCFEARYVRTNGYVDGASYPVVALIESKEELDAYCEANAGRYDLARHDATYADQTIGFLDACDRYDEAYFDGGRNLVLILLEEPSGSIRHKITDVRRNEKGEWVVSIDRIVPECGTADMAEWHLFLELQMGNVIGREDTITVELKDTEPASAALDEAHPVAITSGGNVIYPYPHFLYGETWTGEGFLCADGVPVGMTLSAASADGSLPTVPYSEDLAVAYAENVTFRSMRIYDGAFEAQGELSGPAELPELGEGEHYIGIVVNAQGRYIEEAEQYECTGWECLFRLTV